MAITYNVPKIKDIKDFASLNNLSDWLPNLFADQYTNNFSQNTKDIEENFN